MRSNYTLFRVWGIPIRINISLVLFLPVLAWLIGSGEQLTTYATLITDLTPATVDAAELTGQQRWLVAVCASVGLFASIAFHELGHAWAAIRYDIEVESITLWILGGLASLSAMPKEWNREFWIAIAGPVSSLVLAGACLGTLAVVPESRLLVVFVLGFLTLMNVFLALFNMLPAFPMDGGRVLRALLARDRSYVNATGIAARIGSLFAVLFLILGVLSLAPLFLLLGVFIYLAANGESRSVLLESLLEGLTVDDVRGDHESVEADEPARAVFDRLLETRRSELGVTESGKLVGVVRGQALRDLPFEEYDTATAGSLAVSELPRLEAGTSAFDALSMLTGSRGDLAIVEQENQPVGVVSRSDFTKALDIRRETAAF
jgi:Zn-dependent protease